MVTGKCSAYSSLQSRLKGQVRSLAYELAITWNGSTSTQRTQVNSHIWLCMYMIALYRPVYYYYYYYNYFTIIYHRNRDASIKWQKV